jgi:uncharacterized phage-associated protein
MTEIELLGPPYDGRAVANCILGISEELRIPLTQMKLLKILYFAHGWFLAAHRQPLVTQPFEAWEYGPVVRVVRDALRDFGREAVSGRIEYFDLKTGEIFEFPSNLEKPHREFVEKIFLSYCHYDGWKLSEITHERGSPWDKIWNSAEPIGRLALRIDNKEIQRYFEGMVDRFSFSH